MNYSYIVEQNSLSWLFVEKFSGAYSSIEGDFLEMTYMEGGRP